MTARLGLLALGVALLGALFTPHDRFTGATLLIYAAAVAGVLLLAVEGPDD